MEVGRSRSVVFSVEPGWNSPIHLSAHHLAEEFQSHNWRVLFLANPISPLHVLRSATNRLLRDKVKDWLRGAASEDETIISYVPFTYVPHSRLWPLNKRYTLHQWHRYTVPDLNERLQSISFTQADLMIVDSAMQVNVVDLIHPNHLLFRVTDANRYFSFANRHLVEAEQLLAQRANAVVYTAESLRKYVSELRPRRSCFIPHGIELAHFIGPLPAKPPEYRELNGPVAVYVGSLGEWVDVELLQYASEQLPYVNFVIIGPAGAAVSRFRPTHNFRYLGERAYAEIPAYLRHADIGLIPFARARHPDLVDGINPIKLYEYFACELPVVACRTKELMLYERLLHLYDSPIGFVDAITAAMRIGRNTAGFEYVRDLSWGDVYQKFIGLMRSVDG